MADNFYSTKCESISQNIVWPLWKMFIILPPAVYFTKLLKCQTKQCWMVGWLITWQQFETKQSWPD
jgi:hypothetical protein